MSKHYSLVVFDWEGTLSDTLGQVLSCVAEEARRLNFGGFDEEVARQSVGLGLVNAVKKVFPHLTTHQQEQLLQEIQHSLMTRHNEVYLMPGVKDIVSKLHNAGIHLAIATNKGQHSLHRALVAAELDGYFKVTRSVGQCPPKPCPQMLLEILETFSLSVEDALMVGDTLTDIEMAKSVGMDVVAVNFYHQATDGLLNAGALKVFDDYEQLAAYLHL